RTMTFFISIVLLYLGARVIDAIDSGARVNIPILIASLAALLGLLFVPFIGRDAFVDSNLRRLISLYLIVYAVLIGLMQFQRYRTYAKSAILIVACVEMAHLSSITVNARPVISADEVR